MPGLGRRLDARGGVDEVAGDHALPLGADGDGGLAGEHAGARPQARVELGHGGDEVERGAHGALGVVLVGDRRAPDGHHRVADELLDRAAVALDRRCARGRSSGRAARACPRRRAPPRRREADQVDEEHRHESPLGLRRRSRRGGALGAAERRPALAAELLARLVRGAAARAGDARAARRTPRRTSGPARFSVPQARRRSSAPTALDLRRALDALEPRPRRRAARRSPAPRPAAARPRRRGPRDEPLAVLEQRDGQPERDSRARGSVGARARAGRRRARSRRARAATSARSRAPWVVRARVCGAARARARQSHASRCAARRDRRVEPATTVDRPAHRCVDARSVGDRSRHARRRPPRRALHPLARSARVSDA